MKAMQYIITFLCFTVVTAFGQSNVDWKTKKNVTFAQTGISTEGHSASFSTQIFKKKKQFIELEGGSGIFSPSKDLGQTVSSGLTFNRGFKKHFFSVGVHMAYASDETIQFSNVLNQEAYLSNALIGYHYNAGKVHFKVHIQPLGGISQRITNLGSSASFSIQL